MGAKCKNCERLRKENETLQRSFDDRVRVIEIQLEDKRLLFEEITNLKAKLITGRTFTGIQKNAILETLKQTEGDKAKAAKILDISPIAFDYFLNKY